MIRIFTRDADGRRAVTAARAKFQDDPHWRDLLLFYEYFHGDNACRPASTIALTADGFEPLSRSDLRIGRSELVTVELADASVGALTAKPAAPASRRQALRRR